MTDLATASPTLEQPQDASFEGTFIWYELMTTDQDAAINFYTKVVGWNGADQTMADLDFRYTLLSAGRRPVAGLMQFTGEMGDEGARAGWLGVIGVTDTDETARRVVEAGGALLKGPDDIPNVGRHALLADPGGAVFELLAPIPPEQEPAPLAPTTPGRVSWHELHSGNGQEAAFAFYSKLFGWVTDSEMDMGPMGTYRIFAKNGVQTGGMMDKPDNVPAPNWLFYINVESIDAAVERIRSYGGQILLEPTQVPGGSWIIQGQDPQGAVFALVGPKTV